ncbi:MAG: TIGR03905 family TSCPD domain-containing protein [Spirochaetales bacterium]|nr:TIGR03905 family TSCPD domain-containing protein [Spirochaetales bacterium]
MKTYSYKPKGVCARKIDIRLNSNNIIEKVRFTGGCAGNTAGVARLAEGSHAEEIIKALEGTPCGMRGTSCPDQLAQALKEMLAAGEKSA